LCAEHGKRGCSEDNQRQLAGWRRHSNPKLHIDLLVLSWIAVAASGNFPEISLSPLSAC
jgi:hypothetical protein